MASTITTHPGMAPSPHVIIDVDDAELDPATRSAVVMQVSQWGEVPVNRQPRPTSGGLVITDYEAPLAVPLVYRVRQYDESGADLGLSPLTLTTEIPFDYGRVVLSDPMAPGNAVLVDAEISFAGRRQRSRPTRIYQAGGSSFAMSGLYSAMQEVSLRCFTDTTADADELAEILEQPIILARAHPRTGIPGSFYATIPEPIADTSDNARFGRETTLWDLVASQLSRPSIDILVPIYTYQLYKQYLDAKYPPEATYDDAAREWSNYLDSMRNPPSASGV